MVQLNGQGRHVMGQAQGLSRVKLSLLFLSCKSQVLVHLQLSEDRWSVTDLGNDDCCR